MQSQYGDLFFFSVVMEYVKALAPWRRLPIVAGGSDVPPSKTAR
jgi:hypothetical protein